jgi:hypothetical protein
MRFPIPSPCLHRLSLGILFLMGCDAGSTPQEARPTRNQPCLAVSDCSGGETCSDGVCRGLCGAEQLCEGSELCQAGLCQPLRRCASNAECVGGELCRGGLCVTSCLGDSDCSPPLAFCGDQRLCVQCLSNAQCETGTSCLEGRCVGRCQSDEACPPEAHCSSESGRCVDRICEDASDCQTGYTCIEGECARAPAMVCEPNERSCSEDRLSLIACTPDGSRRDTTSCGPGSACVTSADQAGSAAGPARCALIVCSPWSVGCDDERTAWACDGSGTDRVQTACGFGFVCQDGACIADDSYHAVIVDDSEIFPFHRRDGSNPCLTSQVDAHGADIDAVMLLDPQGQNPRYLENVRLALGTQCQIGERYRLPEELKGLPDGLSNENFVSLGGGYIAGEFQGRPEVVPGATIVVFEVGSAAGQRDEGYDLYVARDVTCGHGGSNRSGCQFKIGRGRGESSFNSIHGF